MMARRLPSIMPPMTMEEARDNHGRILVNLESARVIGGAGRRPEGRLYGLPGTEVPATSESAYNDQIVPQGM
jgi:hypothetical protein